MPKPKAFLPAWRFPAISITGRSCSLGCDYCRGRYLSGMIEAETPKKLYEVARIVARKGAKGILISGGFTEEGRLPIEPFIPIIKQVKRDFNLIISVHSGIVDESLASKLREAGVDIVDYELVIDPMVIRKLKHLRKSPDDFLKGYDLLLKHGPPHVAPHIPIGLNNGRLSREEELVELLKGYDPYIVIFLVFTPARGTPMEKVKPPDAGEVIGLIKRCKHLIGGKSLLSMGCMRPWSIKPILDRMLIEQEIVDRIVNPPPSLMNAHNLERVEACCSVPEKLLHGLP